jgi:Zn-dependent protease with chaperone function
MDFFESQDRARRKTGHLVIFFILAVIAIIVMVHLVVSIGVMVGAAKLDKNLPILLTDWRLMLGVAAGTILVVSLGSLYKIAELRRGGSYIAERLGGRPIPPDTANANERKLLNVVEEMAIASGVPCPPVYHMDDEGGINAFAAGYEPGDAVIGVTRGCVERLSRDELQGVMAHEFSHILNGDMRLNIRLMGVLHGILIIGLIGYMTLRMAIYTPRSSRDKGNAALALLAIGGGLAVVGFAGTFFGNLIKAAVSRQREYLADASAVQFTRNPLGIAGALKKIGGIPAGAAIKSPNGPEASHMFFGRGITSGLNSMFATHPPLGDRIKRIEPSWNGNFPEVEPVAPTGYADAARSARGFTSGARAVRRSKLGFAGEQATTPTAEPLPTAVAQIGQLTMDHVAYADELLAAVPESIRDAAHETYGARALVLALLTDRNRAVREKQLAAVAKLPERGLEDEVKRLLPDVIQLDARLRLPVIDLAIPALRSMSRPQFDAFRGAINDLIAADDRLDLFEWSLHRILSRHLARHFEGHKPRRAQFYGLARLAPHCSIVLSTLAYTGHSSHESAAAAFAKGTTVLGGLDLEMQSPDACGPRSLDTALDALDLVVPRLKKQVLTACAQAIAHDGEVTIREAEVFRGVADALGCPMPPMLPGQKMV